MLLFKKLSKNATTPSKGSQYSAGYDLYSANDLVVAPFDRALVPTDISFVFPLGCYGRIAPRSGLALKKFISVGAGVIDRDYTGNVGVIIFNHSNMSFRISRGDKIAQIICEKCEYPDLKEIDDIEPTDRGDNGFGSTGL